MQDYREYGYGFVSIHYPQDTCDGPSALPLGIAQMLCLGYTYDPYPNCYRLKAAAHENFSLGCSIILLLIKIASSIDFALVY